MNKQANKLFLDGTIAFSRAERQGMRIDVNYINKTKKKLTHKINLIELKLKKTSFYKEWQKFSKKSTPNLNSNLQLANYLYTGKKITPKKLTTSRKGATDEEALEQLNIPELNEILHIRKLKKIRDTYLEAIGREQVNEFIHPFFNLHTVQTFRSSSNQPNFQNLPNRDKESMKIVKDAIFPRKGNRLMEVDFSSLEVSIAACYHKDPNMLKYLRNKNTDMHGDIAAEIFLIDDFDKSIPEHSLLRSATKNSFVFPEFYGDYYKNCAVNLCQWTQLPTKNWKTGQGVNMPNNITISDHLRYKGIKSYTAFEKRIKEMENDLWENRFPIYYRWKNKIWNFYQQKGYIENKTGFKFYGLMTKNQVINYPVQSAAFHCLLWSFIELDKVLQKCKTKLVGQIHDSVVLDVNPFEFQYICNLVTDITTIRLPAAWDWIIVPLKIEKKAGGIDESWADLKVI